MVEIRDGMMHLPDRLAWPTDAAVTVVLSALAGTEATLRQVRAPAGHVAPDDWHSAIFTADTFLMEVNLRAIPTMGVERNGTEITPLTIKR